jgi:hypothetical protein
MNSDPERAEISVARTPSAQRATLIVSAVAVAVVVILIDPSVFYLRSAGWPIGCDVRGLALVLITPGGAVGVCALRRRRF